MYYTANDFCKEKMGINQFEIIIPCPSNEGALSRHGAESAHVFDEIGAKHDILVHVN